MAETSIRALLATALYELKPAMEQANAVVEFAEDDDTRWDGYLEYLAAQCMTEMLRELIDIDARYPGLVTKERLYDLGISHNDNVTPLSDVTDVKGTW